MATATATQTANARRMKGLTAAEATAGETTHLTRETILLIAGGIVFVVLTTIGVLCWMGILDISFSPGEPTGANQFLDFFVLGLIALMGPYGFAMTGKMRRISKIEERLPDFLRDVAEAGRFGMTLPDAIIVASTGRYGLLTDEIKKMASQLEWGVPVATALHLFEERVDRAGRWAPVASAQALDVIHQLSPTAGALAQQVVDEGA